MLVWHDAEETDVLPMAFRMAQDGYTKDDFKKGLVQQAQGSSSKAKHSHRKEKYGD